jgi:hypothetical protein
MSDTLTNLTNGLSDPIFGALTGMTGGFAQAAMPSRMPVPLGAALGLAAQGMTSGAKSAYETQLGAETVRGKRIQNQLSEMALPFRKQMFDMLGNDTSGNGGGVGVYGSTAGDGSGAPTATGASALTGQSGVSGQGAPLGVPNYLTSPQFLRNLAIANVGMGNDRTASTLFGNLQSGAGGAGYAFDPTGRAFAVPGGPHDPGVITRNTIASELPKAQIDVQKAWQLLAPEAQKALTAAGIDVNKAWNTPQSYMPGATVGTPAQLQGGASLLADNVPADPFPGIAQRINGVENGTGDPAARNPQSSATGNGQFLDSTWPSVIRATRPDLAAGRTDQQLLPLRANPQLAAEATTAYARLNAGILTQNGMQPTPGNIYMAHALGPSGALGVLRASPQTPVGMLLPADVIAKNPYLQQAATAGGVRQYFDQKMGSSAAPATSSGGKPALIPASPNITEAQEEGRQLAEMPKEINATAREGQNALLRIQQVRQAMGKATEGGLPAGYFSPELAQAAAAAKSLGINTKTLGIDPAAVSNQQSAQEALVQVSGEILKRLFPQRITNMDIKLYQSSLPHYGMDPGALDQILGLAEQQAQYDVATGKSMNQWKSDKGTLKGWKENWYLNSGYGPDAMQALQSSPATAPEASSAPAPARKPDEYSLQNPAKPSNADDLAKLSTGTPYVNPRDGKIYIYKGTGNARTP